MKHKYLLLSVILSIFLILFFTTSLALIPGDFGSTNNGPSDGVVDFEDLMIFAMVYGSTPSDSNWNSVCDIAGPDGKLTPDGVIDFEDLMVFAMNYGEEETIVPDYTQGLSWAGAVKFDGETYLKGGDTYNFTLTFDHVITDPELRYVVIKDYSNPATPGIIFYEFMTLDDLNTTDNMVFIGTFTPPSICDNGISKTSNSNSNGTILESGEYCTAAYVEVFMLDPNCCAPYVYKFNVDATLPKSEIKITVDDCCGLAYLEFDSVPIDCDDICCGDECTELVGWAIDIFDTMPVYYCGELITEEKCHFENSVCPVSVHMPTSGCSECCLDTGDYWIITTLEDKVGNLGYYYVKTNISGSTGAWNLFSTEYYRFGPPADGDFWLWDGTEFDNPFHDSNPFDLDGNPYGDPCPWIVLYCNTLNRP